MNATATDEVKIQDELSRPFKLSAEQIAQFQKDGYIKLKNVLSPELLSFYAPIITEKVFELCNYSKPMEERTTYEKAFLQIGNLWTKSDTIKEFAFSRRLAQIAAELMGVKGVRMYHDQALYKEPGGGITPFHADQYYWPVDTNNTVTAWIPLQKTPVELGPLSFSVGSHQFNFGRDIEISDESENKLQHSLKERNYPLDESAYDLGEISYHYGWTFHRAGRNDSDRPRGVMTVIYIEDGCRMTTPRRGQVADAQAFFPHLKPGDKIDGPLVPVLYHHDA